MITNVFEPRGTKIRYINSPCYNCGDRNTGCHAFCDEYKSYKIALENEKKSAGYNAVIISLTAPFVQLCINSDMVITRPTKNGYNFKTNVWEDLKKAGVIDPTLVLKNAITNAVGIASNLLTTECITYKE